MRGRGNYNNAAGSKQGKGGGGGGGGVRGRGDGGAISNMSVPPRPASSPPHPNLSGNTKQPRGQGNATTPIGHPKSKQVIQIEKLLKALHESSSSSGGKTKDPKGGCFCLGEAALGMKTGCCAHSSSSHCHRPCIPAADSGCLHSFIHSFVPRVVQ